MAEKTLVCTGLMGRLIEHEKYTAYTIRNYADKIGAEYHIIKDHTRQWPQHRPTYEKYQMYKLLEYHDRILWIDGDVIVSPEAPNLFNLIHPDYMAALWESPTYSEHDTKRQHLKNIKKMQDALTDIGWTTGIFNAGVMLLSKEHQKIFHGGFESYLPFQNWKWNDQAILNYRRVELKIPFEGLGWKWNAMPYYESEERMKRAHFLHFAGKQTKKDWDKYLKGIKKFYDYFHSS